MYLIYFNEIEIFSILDTIEPYYQETKNNKNSGRMQNKQVLTELRRLKHSETGPMAFRLLQNLAKYVHALNPLSCWMLEGIFSTRNVQLH